MARALGWSQSEYARFERGRVAIPLVDVARAGALIGLELSAGLHPFGEPILDRGHQELIRRFRALLSASWRVVAEVPLPNPGDRRSWDLLLRIPEQLVGVEAETRVRDVQRLVRHVHQRERDGGVDVIVLVLAATRTNRALVDDVRQALGPSYATPARQILRALRAGQPLPGSGVVLI